MHFQFKIVDRPMVWFFIASVLSAIFFSGCGTKQSDYLNVLVFSKTAGYRHSSIPKGQEMFFQLAKKHNFQVDTTEDARIFNPQDLAKYNVVVFLSTTGDVLDTTQELALKQFMQAGGGWMGIHAAADTEYEWSWYNQLVGAYFNGHPNDPNVRTATIKVDDHNHPATTHLGETWKRTDEWYNYKNIQPFTTLMRLDETTYEGGTNGEDHPIAWYREFENGRMFYTGSGHTDESFTDPDFIQHVWGGLDYVAGERKKIDYSLVSVSPEENRFQVETLVRGLYEPMEMVLLPDGRVLWVQRHGEIMIYDPEFEATAEVGKMDVWTKFEDGLLGIALDPDFTSNNWVYLFYSPNTDDSVNQLSRFKWTGNGMDMASEQRILAVPTDRNECCHSGGSIEFGPTGLLYLSVGDNTNPFQSDGYAPIDDSQQLQNFDARRSASNTNDLRGKILRIKVNEDGTYSVPSDNLFPNGEGGRPEIYVMGCRNPFRISIDQQTGVLYWGDVGPDAGKDSTGMGPRGHCEFNYAPTAGYYGWPLFVADNKAYHQRNFVTKQLGAAFDPLHPINDSKYNTGARELPPARPAMVFYPYAVSPEFPTLGDGGRNPMAGPVYRKASFSDTANGFPDYFDGKFFMYEWMRDWIMVAELDKTGKITSFERFLPNLELLHPMDMLFGPDGSLYIIEYGKLWFKENPDARILRIRYNGGNRPPVPAMEVAHRIGAAPFELIASIGKSYDYDGDELTATWWLEGEKIGEGKELKTTIQSEGVKTLTMELSDGNNNVVSETAQLIIGNSLPELVINLDGNRSFYFPGQQLVYNVQVMDAEDGALGAGIDPKEVTVTLDFLEGEDLVEVAYGHQMATEETQFVIGKRLIGKSDCAACHAIGEKNIGPSYLQVAKKYRAQANAVDYLAGKIIKGGGGVWGEQAMSAHPDLTTSQAEQMANYILSLAGPAPNAKGTLPLAGTQKLNKHQAGQSGRYYLQATYTDKGAADGLPRLTGRENVVLRSPIQSAHQMESGDKVMPYTVTPDQNPTTNEETQALMVSGGGWAGYGSVDLTSITNLKATVLLVPDITSGGTIEVVTGNPKTGKVIGTYTLVQGPKTYGENTIDIPILPIESSKQPFFLRFKADGDNAAAAVGVVEKFEFQRSRVDSK